MLLWISISSFLINHSDWILGSHFSSIYGSSFEVINFLYVLIAPIPDKPLRASCSCFKITNKLPNHPYTKRKGETWSVAFFLVQGMYIMYMFPVYYRKYIYSDWIFVDQTQFSTNVVALKSCTFYTRLLHPFQISHWGPLRVILKIMKSSTNPHKWTPMHKEENKKLEVWLLFLFKDMHINVMLMIVPV